MQQAKKQTPRRGPAAKGKKRAALSAQQTIPYVRMLPDGVCQLPGGLYTKTVEYEDINYSVASTEDQTAIFSGWSSFLNYFDSSLPFQLSFINRRSHSRSRYKVNIPQAEDDFNSVRAEFTGMLKNQIARSNNGIERSKYITFGIPAESLDEARPRLERVEADVMSNFKRLGVPSEPMDGRARLALLHGQMHPGSREPFRFSWGDIAKTGLGTKDFIAPDSFDFRQPRLFRMGQYWGAASYLQILASELSDKLLAEILELDAEMTVTLHIQTVDQLKAIKTIKGKISDIGKMKVEEQRKAVRAGYDPDILPPDLITFSKDAAELLADLQSRNERMFLLTFTVVNLAPTRQRLENDIFTVGGIAQKYNCTLKRLDWQGGNPAGHDYQLHGGLHSLYDQGAPHGRAVPLLRHERTFPQRHYGGQEKAEIREWALPGLYWLRQELRGKAGAAQRLSYHSPGSDYHCRPDGRICPAGAAAGRPGD